jgi:hypothetical protein
MINTRDDARVSKAAIRIAEAFERPLTAPGSESLARLVLAQFGPTDLVSSFAKKAIQTLDDGHSHSLAVVSPEGTQRFAVTFVTWNGTHREVQAERVGRYFSALYATAAKFIELGVQLTGFLEIDAYVREDSDITVDVEYSYLPGFAFGSSAPVTDRRFRVIHINPHLCSEEERRALSRLEAR